MVLPTPGAWKSSAPAKIRRAIPGVYSEFPRFCGPPRRISCVIGQKESRLNRRVGVKDDLAANLERVKIYGPKRLRITGANFRYDGCPHRQNEKMYMRASRMQ